MQIQLPENLSTRLRQLAARRRQPVEKIVADRLFTALDDELDSLPSIEKVELRALHHLSADALRAIAAEQMLSDNQALLARLMERNSRSILTDCESLRVWDEGRPSPHCGCLPRPQLCEPCPRQRSTWARK